MNRTLTDLRHGNVSLIPLRGSENEMRNSVAAFNQDSLAVSKQPIHWALLLVGHPAQAVHTSENISHMLLNIEKRILILLQSHMSLHYSSMCYTHAYTLYTPMQNNIVSTEG